MLAAIVLGFVALLVALPFFVDWYATRWLKAHGLVDASIEDVDIDLFRGRVGLDGLVLTDTEDSRTRATRTFVNLRWQGLFRERLVLGRMEMTDAEMEALESGEDVDREVHALKVMLAKCGRHIFEEAIQLHGGIAMTWEYALGHYAKRLTMIDHELGDTDYHLSRYIALSQQAATA